MWLGATASKKPWGRIMSVHGTQDQTTPAPAITLTFHSACNELHALLGFAASRFYCTGGHGGEQKAGSGPDWLGRMVHGDQ